MFSGLLAREHSCYVLVQHLVYSGLPARGLLDIMRAPLPGQEGLLLHFMCKVSTVIVGCSTTGTIAHDTMLCRAMQT